MFLEILFPQIVIVIGVIGVLICFGFYFAPEDKKEQHHKEHH